MTAAAIQSSRTSRLLDHRKALIALSQTCLLALTYWFSFLLAFDLALDPVTRALLMKTLPLMLCMKLLLFQRFGLTRGWWCYVGISDVLDISLASLAASGVFYVLLFPVLRVHGFPMAVILIDLLLTVVVTGGARVAVRSYTEYATRSYAAQKNTLVVGAGRAGAAIVGELQRNALLDYNPIGFVDDDVTKKGIKIHGIRVLGTTENMQKYIAENAVQCVLIAIPSAKGATVERIISKCRECNVDFKILPAIRERINGNGSTSIRHLRDVRVEDLLGRDPVRLEVEDIRQKLQGRTALITGAGGSIGSELARQIAAFQPRKLVLFERSENDLFKLGLELTARFPQLKFVPVVGDILDVGALRDVFSLYRPHSVFHAAAYKHVPMMECNCCQAVTNNIFGTYDVALVASQYEVEDFVMISSDKAVNPASIMGVTKRVAELIILGLQDKSTRFISVRFGNVLGSNGSVLPIFQQQIAKGGPVTVTHPDAKRFFMTIPEAVLLVLQASTMGKGGEIFTLNMGEPVSIAELARTLIRLSGLTPDRDIKIVYTGLRPGEKLIEELMLVREGLKPTPHTDIRVLDGGKPDFLQIRSWLDELSAAVEAKNVSRLINQLKAIVPEYTPSAEVLSLCEVDRHDHSWRYKRDHAGLTLVQTQSAA
jgi:FlaA1/EpsC-like NDP-sugar epimerase